MAEFNICNKIITAPLAGVTDKPFRKILSGFGPGLIYSEMISSEALTRSNVKTYKMIDFSNENYKIAAQIFGANADKIAKAAELIQEYAKPYSIDLNMGCPIKKIVKNGAGAALLKDLKKIEEIIKKTAPICRIPLTIKIRTGWNTNEDSFLQIGKIAEDNGISAIALHGRSAAQMYSGRADWDKIEMLKKNINIPVIGNGDILTGNDFFKNVNRCDYIMIGRGLLYNPFLIREINGENPPSIKELKNLMTAHLNELLKEYGEFKAVRHFRKYFSWYLKNIRNAKLFREEGFKIKNHKDFITLVGKIL